MNFDDSFKYLLGIGATALTSAAGLLYKGTQARIRKAEESIATKADKGEVERLHENQHDLWEAINAVRKDMNGGFESVRKDMHELHVDIIERLPRRA